MEGPNKNTIENRSEYFEEGFDGFKKFLEENKIKGGILYLKKWNSGDASTTLSYETETGGGMQNLNKFHPKGFDWYCKSDTPKGVASGIAKELEDFLSQNNIKVEREN